MVLVQNYTLAVFLCVLAMICWGSWQNTRNLIGKEWRFELFYWDYSIGIVLFALLMAFTFGSLGSQGRSFCPTWHRPILVISSHLQLEDLYGM
jgi:glucose uptake protein